MVVCVSECVSFAEVWAPSSEVLKAGRQEREREARLAMERERLSLERERRARLLDREYRRPRWGVAHFSQAVDTDTQFV